MLSINKNLLNKQKHPSPQSPRREGGGGGDSDKERKDREVHNVNHNLDK